jgi:hypothetical protein
LWLATICRTLLIADWKSGVHVNLCIGGCDVMELENPLLNLKMATKMYKKSNNGNLIM